MTPNWSEEGFQRIVDAGKRSAFQIAIHKLIHIKVKMLAKEDITEERDMLLDKVTKLW